jgi:Arc/MetJ-type ribon-helix-helix transcriptional regulator
MGNTMAQQNKKMKNLNIRVPLALKELIEKYISLDCHTNISDFTRDALRQKIQRETPHLYRQLFEKEVNNK